MGATEIGWPVLGMYIFGFKYQSSVGKGGHYTRPELVRFGFGDRDVTSELLK